MRRSLFFTICLIAILIPGGPHGMAQGRAGVFFDSQSVPAYRQYYSSPGFADLRKELQGIDRMAERKFLQSEVHYDDQLIDILRVGTVAQQMALLYVYTGDTDAAKLAHECIESLLRFPKWDYFLEGGVDLIGLQRAPSSAIAVALVIEALGDLVTPAERKEWLTTMAARGTEPCYRATFGMRYPDRVKGWSIDTASNYFQHRPGERGINLSRWPIILDKINLKAVPASALTLTALTYRKYLGETPDTRRWLEQGVYSISTFRDIYARDGSYAEGISYAHYTTLHLVQAIEALRAAGVADLSDLLNWTGYQTYLCEMSLSSTGDSTAIVNFCDAGKGANASVSFWISRETRDGMGRWFGEQLAVSRDMWAPLFYDPTVPAVPPLRGPHVWQSGLDWTVARTGYGAEDLVVAMRSGGPSNHEHADRNSIIVKSFGERLVVDPMRPPYAYTDPAWKMRLTGGHSAVLIDGQGHQYVDGREGTNASLAQAAIVRKGERAGYLFWTSDATPAYRLVLPDVLSVTRTVIVLTDIPAVILVDKVVKGSLPSTIQARFYTYNNDEKGRVSRDDAGFSLFRPAACLEGRSASTAGVTYVQGLPAIPPEQARLYPYVDVGTLRPSKSICLATVLLPAPGPTPTGIAEVVATSTGFQAKIARDGKSTVVTITDRGNIPAFEIH
jgi:hypothetical protein